jgi:hypothetical protein
MDLQALVLVQPLTFSQKVDFLAIGFHQHCLWVASQYAEHSSFGVLLSGFSGYFKERNHVGMFFWGFNCKIGDDFELSAREYVLEWSSDWIQVFLLVEFETEVLLGGFADGGFERDVFGFGGETCGGEESDSHEWEDQVFLLVVKEVVLDGLAFEVEFGLFGDDFLECKRFFFFEDFNSCDNGRRSGQVWDNGEVLDIDVATRVGDGILNLSFWELKPARGDVGFGELAHEKRVNDEG